MKIFLIVIFYIVSFSAISGGWTSTAPVDELEIVRGQGFFLKGSFGNPSECTNENTLFVYKSHSQYDQMLSIALSAFMSGKKLRIYTHQCANFGWHGGTHNELTNDGAMFIKH